MSDSKSDPPVAAGDCAKQLTRCVLRGLFAYAACSVTLQRDAASRVLAQSISCVGRIGHAFHCMKVCVRMQQAMLDMGRGRMGHSFCHALCSCSTVILQLADVLFCAHGSCTRAFSGVCLLVIKVLDCCVSSVHVR